MKKTSSGFEYELDPAIANDMELLEDLAGWDDGNLVCVPRAIERLLGKEQKDALYNHLRGEDGRVPTDKVMAEVIEIFNSTKETKTS